MKRTGHSRRILHLLFLFVALPSLASAQAVTATAVLNHHQFGKLLIYAPGPKPKGLALLLAGERGWMPQMAHLAQAIALQDYLVAGIDTMAYLSQTTCHDLVTDLTGLAGFLEHQYHLPARPAILIGYAEGAAVVYTALVQAPAATFHVGISLDFCPHRPQFNLRCNGPALTDAPADDEIDLLSSRKRLATTWFVFQSEPACDKDEASRFVKQIDNAKLTILPPKDEDGASGEKEWPQLMALLQWLSPNIAKQVEPDRNISGVPLTEVPAVAGTSGKRLAVMLSGDGGWAELDRAVAAELARHGVATVGWDSLSYFWQAKTPEQAGADLERVLRHYTEVWNKEEVLLIGYSFGADVLPFMANQLSPALRHRIKLIAFLGLSKTASFEFHLTDWLGGAKNSGLPVPPQVRQLAWAKRLCLYGAEETDSACPELAKSGVGLVRMPGDHHFDGNYRKIAERILERAN